MRGGTFGGVPFHITEMVDKEKIKQWWQVFVGEGELVEIRILGRFQYSGYFKSPENLADAIEPYTEMPDEQIYFTINKINEACYGRQQCEKIIKSPKTTTTDNDIISRKFVLLDFDPKRAAGVNASEAEFELAHKKAQEVFKFLKGHGFEDPVICVSGNGWHAQYKVDLPNTDEVTETLKRFLQALGLLFSDDSVEVDEKVFNPGRICKLYSTTAKKGANLPERPWRVSQITYVPKELKCTPLEKFRAIADMLPKETQNAAYTHNGHGRDFNLDAFLSQHNVKYKKVKVSNGVKYILEHCFFDENHKGKDAVLFQYDNGAICYVCLHQSCKNHTWRDVRLLLDPHAYDNEQHQSRQLYGRYGGYPPRQEYKIKEANPELGEKWLCLSNIQKIDLSQIESVKTGFTELDRLIVGLNMSEVTLLSGSNASGKSAWLNSLLLNIVNQGYKIALWSGELRADILKAWIQMVAAGKENLLRSQFAEDKFYVPNEIGERIDRWLDGKFFLYNNEYGNTWQQIFHDMDELLKIGVKVFALDNLFSLDIDLFGGDKNNKQKELILEIKDFAKKNQVHIILVAHPRKVTTFLRKNDISGTSDLTNAVDDVFIIHRVNQDFIRTGAEFYSAKVINQFSSCGNVIEVAKNRMYGVVDALIGLQYEKESRRFKNEEYERIFYGWEQMPAQQEYQQPRVPYNEPQELTNDFFTQDDNVPY